VKTIRLAVRTAGGLATTTLMVALAVAGFAGWGTPTAAAGWTVAAWAAGAALLFGLLRAVLGAHSQYLDVLALSILVWVCAAVLTFSLSYFLYAHALDDHATLRVSASVTDCVDQGDAGNECSYHWTVDGHAYSSRDSATRRWPDGHRVTVRIDPAHPSRPALVSRAYWAAWIGIVIGLVGMPFAALMWWSLGAGLD
jgi:hypothetical protein